MWVERVLALAVLLAAGITEGRTLVKVNCGGANDEDSLVVAPQNTMKETLEPRPRITGTRKQGRYSKFRRAQGDASLTYRFKDIPNSPAHRIRLGWAEVTDCRAGARVFDVYVNGEELFKDFDPFVAAGRRCRHVVKRRAEFAVENGVVELELRRKPGSAQPPMLNFVAVKTVKGKPKPSPTPAACADLGVITRKSATEMSSQEWTQYVAAFNRMKRRAAPGGVNVYERFSRIHLDHALHRQAGFLPWHREMLWQWDRELAIDTPQGEPPARQPYFEWAASARDPFGGSLSRSSRYGGNGAVGGAFGALVSNVPSNHRVVRQYNQSRVLTNSRTMNLLRSNVADFTRFRITLEGNHDSFHVRVGGDMVVRILQRSLLQQQARERAVSVRRSFIPF